MSEQPAERGRGAPGNPPGRFERLAFVHEPSDEAGGDDEIRPALLTELYRDTSKSILAFNDSPDVPMDATVNPYRGCEHGCIYCYARPYHEYLGLSAGTDFERRIFVKENAAALLRGALSAKSWTPQVIGLSGVTDPYQPIERKLRITRACLEVLAEFRNPVTIITKNHLVTRDIDVLASADTVHEGVQATRGLPAGIVAVTSWLTGRIPAGVTRMARRRLDVFAGVWAVIGLLGFAAWPSLERTAAAGVVPAFEQAIPGSSLRWYKGNTHTHTLNSDGDSTPDAVVRWYREHGYHFLVLTDHNFLTTVDGLNALHGANEKFLVIKGEEVTSSFQSKAVHVNGLDVSAQIEPTRNAASMLATIQGNVDAIRKVDGVPHINHPNFTWAMTPDDLRQVRNNKLFEVYNGHPTVHNEGGGGVVGLEQAWDQILSQGTLLYGIAVDDAHTFKDPGNPNVAGPGRGWIAIRSARLEARALLAALERGDFYASTGVDLADIRTTTSSMTVEVRPRADFKYRIQFIGKGGRVLHESIEPTATYTFSGTEGYVRAKVIDSGGRAAWVQPVPVK